MNQFRLTFHHLGLAVTKKGESLLFIKGLGYSIEDEIYDPQQKVNLILCHSNDMPDIEIISRADDNGPLDAILRDRREVIYHICYQTPDLESSLKSIENNKNRPLCVSRSKQAVLFPGKYVSFYIISGFGLIEFIHDKSI